MNKLSNRFLVIMITLIGAIFMVIGATFAYFTSSASNNNGIIGNAYIFNTTMSITTKKSGSLIPLKSSLIDRTMKSNNKCVDLNGNDICSYYQVTITNNGNIETLFGYIKTEDIANKYTTDHLHFKLYDTNYEPISGEGVLSPTVNSINYFKTTTNTNNLSLTLPIGSSVYYLAVWLNDPDDSNQLEDVNKKFVGSLVFEGSSGGKLSGEFES